MSWDPTFIDDSIWGWWDFSTAAGQVGGGSIDGWSDLSSNDRTITASFEALTPTNDLAFNTLGGLQAVGSPGGNGGFIVDYPLNEIDTGFLLVGMVANQASSGGSGRFLGTRDDSGTSWEVTQPNVSGITTAISAAGTWPTLPGTSAGNPFLYTCRLDLSLPGANATATQGRLNGTLTDTVGSLTALTYSPVNNRFGILTQPNDSGVGASVIGGGVGEVVIMQRSSSAYTAEDAQLLEGYMAWKFGIESLLPPAHPYKFGAPVGLVLDLDSTFELNTTTMPRLVTESYLTGSRYSSDAEWYSNTGQDVEQVLQRLNADATPFASPTVFNTQMGLLTAFMDDPSAANALALNGTAFQRGDGGQENYNLMVEFASLLYNEKHRLPKKD